MQQGDYNSYYHHQYSQFQNPTPNPNPNPNPSPPAPATVAGPTDLTRNTYASAPPFTGGYGSADYSNYSQNYTPYGQNSEHVPPSAPSFTSPSQPPPSPPATSLNPNSYSTFNQPPPPPTIHPQPLSSYGSFDSTAPYQQPTSQHMYYSPYDQHQTSGYSSAPPPSSAPAPNPNPAPYSSSLYSAPPYSSGGSSIPPSYEKPSVKFDQSGYDGYNRSRSDLGSDLYGKRSDSGEYPAFEDSYGDGVYAYQGGKVEPYGSRGTAPKSSNSTLFDDYGRSISFSSSGRDSSVSSNSAKIVRAVPKADVQEDSTGGVQKFRVKLLAETYGQTTTDVLCQIGLDGLRMLDPSTSRTLRIYPLENITRCEKLDSSILAFWSKTPVDIEAKRIRLQSNSYTTNTLLDTVTAAMFQAKEIGGSSRPPTSGKLVEQTAEKKKGLGDWMNIIKPVNEEKDHWVPDEAVSKCTSCGSDFGAFIRRHHCRNCGDVFCDKCTQGRIALTAEDNAPQVRVCDRCMAEVSQRLSNAKETTGRNVSLQSHEDLARKLQEEMERNRKSSSGLREGSGRRMKEVACPTCTVHLQVQVPVSGSETIECGVCQNPFLVSAH
ncbi:Zinc finger FYVE-related [Arabidopsis suecica]|uniref:Zinc finger FYVE-related n=1 Tax=Arabidopsis suecica TaxID=45249 RepID=A0A8T2H584_ARASU|nr:Zinc finger FYVE-related [Arabidopsis suecica]